MKLLILLKYYPNKSFTCTDFVEDDELLKELNDNWDDIAPYLLNYNDTVPLCEHKQLAEKIRKYYLGSKKIDRNTVTPLIQMLSDRSYGVGMATAVKLHAKVNKNPVWSYYYTYKIKEDLSFTNKLGNFVAPFTIIAIELHLSELHLLEHLFILINRVYYSMKTSSRLIVNKN